MSFIWEVIKWRSILFKNNEMMRCFIDALWYEIGFLYIHVHIMKCHNLCIFCSVFSAVKIVVYCPDFSPLLNKLINNHNCSMLRSKLLAVFILFGHFCCLYIWSQYWWIFSWNGKRNWRKRTFSLRLRYWVIMYWNFNTGLKWSNIIWMSLT